MECKFAWFSDCHVGYRQYSLQERKNDFFLALESSIENVVNSGTRLLLIGGDLFHSRSPDFETIQRTGDALAVARNAGIDIVCILGNHDFDPGSNVDWIKYFGLLRPPYTYDYNILISGLDWFGLALPKNIPPPQKGKKNILMMHWGYNSQSNPSYTRLLELGYDLVLLGHIHKYYNIKNTIYSSGSLESTSTSEWFNRNGVLFFDEDIKLIRKFEPRRRRRFKFSFDLNRESLNIPLSNKLKDSMILIKLSGSRNSVDEAANEVRDVMEKASPLIYKIKKDIVITNGNKKTPSLIYDEESVLKDLFKDNFDIVNDIMNGVSPDKLIERL